MSEISISCWLHLTQVFTMRYKTWPNITRQKRCSQKWPSKVSRSLIHCKKRGSEESPPKCSARTPSPPPGPSGVTSSTSPCDCPSSEERVGSAKRKSRCDEEEDEGNSRKRFRTKATPKKHKFKAKYGYAFQKKQTRYLTEPKEQESEDRNIINGKTEEFRKKYMKTDFLEKGGFGRVFAGVRVEDYLPVALKFIPKHLVRYTVVEMDGKFVKIPQEVNFLIKAGAVTPRLLDWYKVGRDIVLVLERPDPCLDLVDYINSSKYGMTPNKAKIIFLQLVDDAIYLDSIGIFHHDIKLENVLLGIGTDIPRAWFIDFGCATFFTPGQKFEHKQGTTEYIPPEWFQGSKYIAENATVWQLGILLYAMIFKDLPLLTEESLGSVRNVTIPPSAAPECRDLLKGCLEKNPCMRLSLQHIRDHPWLNSE